MKIVGIKVENYKSFRQTEWLKFGPGFNAIVGKNNVGKTALLEAISTRFISKPHRSFATLPNAYSNLNDLSTVTIIFDFSGAEIIEGLRRDKKKLGTNLYFPFEYDQSPETMQNFINYFHTLPSVKIESELQNGNDSSFAFLQEHLLTIDPLIFAGGRLHPVDPILEFVNAQRGGKHSDINALPYIVNLMRNRIYIFQAERPNIGKAASQPEETLSSDARNLASVLNTLQLNDPDGFTRYQKAVQIVFPNIAKLTVPQSPQREVEIMIWEDAQRRDLALSVLECGTGIGQVLAMLYVVLNTDDPRVIIIDEPQSFLHPGAIRKLFDILRLKEFSGRPLPEHQYIISTHSPVAITAANPSTIFLVTKEGAESKVEPIDINETNQVRSYLQEIGASLSDVFGAEQILWVEGKTEEQCFPLILTGICQEPLFGTAIVGIVHTGDFSNKKDRKLALQVYERLSKTRGILPPALGFIFDKEELDPDGIKDFERIAAQFNVPVYFSVRRMYENYLLNSTAIAWLLASLGLSVSIESIQQWMEENRWSTKYIRGIKGEKSIDTWLVNVDGAEFLKDIFHKFSEEAPHEYDKVQHGLLLTTWLVENSPEDLREVADLLLKALKINKASS